MVVTRQAIGRIPEGFRAEPTPLDSRLDLVGCGVRPRLAVAAAGLARLRTARDSAQRGVGAVG